VFARNTPMSFDTLQDVSETELWIYPPAGTVASILTRSLTPDFCMVAMGTGSHLIQPWSICGLMDKTVASFGVSISHYLIRKCHDNWGPAAQGIAGAASWLGCKASCKWPQVPYQAGTRKRPHPLDLQFDQPFDPSCFPYHPTFRQHLGRSSRLK
jgi:hypothetical protein